MQPDRLKKKNKEKKKKLIEGMTTALDSNKITIKWRGEYTVYTLRTMV